MQFGQNVEEMIYKHFMRLYTSKHLQYFALVLILLIGIGIGAYFIFTGNIDTLKQPFIEGIKEYDRDGTSNADRSLVKLYDDWQQQVS